MFIVPFGYLGLNYISVLKRYYKKPVLYLLIAICLLNMAMITQINPRFIGLGTPSRFVVFQVTEDYVVLYDQIFTFYIKDPDTPGDSRSSVPFLRVHVVDRLTGKPVYRKLIGKDFYPINYGNHVLLVKSRLKFVADELYQGAIYCYDTKQRSPVKLVELGGRLITDSDTINVYSLEVNESQVVVGTNKGEKYLLSKTNLQFSKVEGIEPVHENNLFSMQLQDNVVEAYKLYSNGKLFDEVYIKGVILDQVCSDSNGFALVFAYKSAPYSNPFISLIDADGVVLWEQSFEQLNPGLYNNNRAVQQPQAVILHEKIYLVVKHWLYQIDFKTGIVDWKCKP